MARNRMIKPEFWEDDRIASLPFQTRLFYISLWNFADDEGYLELRENWLKAKCFPYDSANIRGMLDELSNIGRLEASNEILKIPNFLKHQRIDRPRSSDLKERFEAISTNIRRALDESSTTKYKRKERKVKEHTHEKREDLKSFGETDGVIMLTEAEHKKLCSRAGGSTVKKYIENMENWKLVSDKNMNKYTNDYRAILNWMNRDKNNGKLVVSHEDLSPQDFDSKEDYEKACLNLINSQQ